MQVPVTNIDRKIAQLAAAYSCRSLEKCLQFTTAIADEKVLIPGSVLSWVIAALRDKKSNEYRHLLLTLIVVTAVDHLSKHAFDQRRPDRIRKRYRKRGIPRSPGEYDSFPSGHTMRLAAVARALHRAHPHASLLIWSTLGLVASTRALLLAHWASDVAVGTAVGLAVEEIVHHFEVLDVRMASSILGMGWDGGR